MVCRPCFLILTILATAASSAESFMVDRRGLLQQGASIATGIPFLIGNSNVEIPSGLVPFDVFRVNPDSSASLNPTLTQVTKDSLFASIAASAKTANKGGAIWLGEHHNSIKDHILQANMIQTIHSLRMSSSQSSTPPPMAIGLEQVQIKFQQVLDDYVHGKISVDKMKTLVEWETRWQWPFEGYRPVFETAQKLGIRIIALNVNSEDLEEVEKGGLPGLTSAALHEYITDLRGFAEFTKPNQFKAYVDYVIRPSYDLHKAMGLLNYSISGKKLEEEMSFRNFYSGRILWDESMASNAFRWTYENPGGLIVGLVGADHVKFVNGIVGRYSRLVGDSRDCSSIMLNPTLIDTRPSGSVGNIEGSASSESPNSITLQLRYVKDGVDLASPDRFLPSNTGGVMQLADYIVVG